MNAPHVGLDGRRGIIGAATFFAEWWIDLCYWGFLHSILADESPGQRPVRVAGRYLSRLKLTR